MLQYQFIKLKVNDMTCKCFHCNKPLPELGSILISPDGDFVCNEKCKRGYEAEKKHFFDNVVNDDKKFEEWMYGG